VHRSRECFFVRCFLVRECYSSAMLLFVKTLLPIFRGTMKDKTSLIKIQWSPMHFSRADFSEDAVIFVFRLIYVRKSVRTGKIKRDFSLLQFKEVFDRLCRVLSLFLSLFFSRRYYIHPQSIRAVKSARSSLSTPSLPFFLPIVADLPFHSP